MSVMEARGGFPPSVLFVGHTQYGINVALYPILRTPLLAGRVLDSRCHTSMYHAALSLKSTFLVKSVLQG